MSYFDNILGRGRGYVSEAERASRERRLQTMLHDVEQRRAQFATRLGESLYQQVLGSSLLRAGNEELIAQIAQCDQARVTYERNLSALQSREEREALKEERRRSRYIACPFCGSRVGSDDLTCASCGHTRTEIMDVLSHQRLYTRQDDDGEERAARALADTLREGPAFNHLKPDDMRGSALENRPAEWTAWLNEESADEVPELIATMKWDMPGKPGDLPQPAPSKARREEDPGGDWHKVAQRFSRP